MKLSRLCAFKPKFAYICVHLREALYEKFLISNLTDGTQNIQLDRRGSRPPQTGCTDLLNASQRYLFWQHHLIIVTFQ